jgi:flagellar biogenesis protein FliO
MRAIRWVVLVSVALFGASARADDGAIESRKVTPPGESVTPFEPSRGVASRGGGAWLSNLLSVGLCLAGGVWIWRSRLRMDSTGDGELWTVVSHRPLDSRHSLMVVRFADSLLLLSVSQNQVSLLKEIGDPAEVAEIHSRVSRQEPSRSNSIRQRLAKLGVLRGTI